MWFPLFTAFVAHDSFNTDHRLYTLYKNITRLYIELKDALSDEDANMRKELHDDILEYISLVKEMLFKTDITCIRHSSVLDIVKGAIMRHELETSKLF